MTHTEQRPGSVFFTDSLSDFEVYTAPYCGERPDFGVSRSYVGRVHCIAFERFLGFESAVEHYIGIGRIQTSVNDDLYVQKPRNHSLQRFETLLDTFLDGFLLRSGQLFLESPQNYVLDQFDTMFKYANIQLFRLSW